jgi:hypothetical protein
MVIGLALTCRDAGEILLGPSLAVFCSLVSEVSVVGVHSPFARAEDFLGVGMAKALLGQRVYFNDRLVLESARLRSRVRDLECLIEDLQQDNDRLRADMPADIEATAQPVF